MNILFVCTGNTCRSPMAEGMMKELVEKQNLKNIEVKSAGVAAFDGAPASEHTRTILQQRGIDLNHASQSVTHELIRWADLILTMTGNHKQVLGNLYPEGMDKTFTLMEYIEDPEASDVMDPFGGSLEVYRETEKDLEAALLKLVQKLARQDSSGSDGHG